MRRLNVFENLSLDGYFVDADGDMSWAHAVPQDDEFDAFTAGNARGGGTLVFGRVTYDMMASYWPTPMAQTNAPVVAERMNAMPKIVFSRTMRRAAWRNTTLLGGDPATELRRIKASAGDDLTVLGSGSIVAQLVQAGLVDTLQIVVSPVVLGAGRTLFEGAQGPIPFRLESSRAFGNGKVVSTYAPRG
jgi:dihydrofolate reductase